MATAFLVSKYTSLVSIRTKPNSSAMGWQPIISNCAELEKQIDQFKLKNRCHLFCISNGPLFRLLSDLSKHFYIKQLWKMSIQSTVLEFEPTTFGKCVSSIWAPAYNCQLLEFPLSERNLKLSEQFIEILSGRPYVINYLSGKVFLQLSWRRKSAQL